MPKQFSLATMSFGFMKRQRPLACPWTLLAKGMFIHLHLIKSLFIPSIILPVSIEDLSSQISYNKCVTAFHQDYLDSAIPKISPELGERFEIFKSRDMLLEWCPKGVQKDRGLEALVEYLGIDASQVMACGDEANDASMLKWAGLGIAMANAVDEVKEIATLVSDYTNDQDAVGRAIEEYVLKEGQ